jgi:carboxypeptidase A5
MLSAVTAESRDDIRYSNEEFWKRYHNLVEIHGYIARLEDKHPEMMKKEVIGQSLENRTLTVYTIHAPGAFDSAKPALWINACQHAREWISPPTALYSVMKLLTGYENDPQVKAILDKINVFYLPFVNPDGYVHTWAGSRMWRKNRRVENGRVVGVDLNRNWRSGFGGPGSSGSPGSETYRGPRALSEPESAAVSRFLTKHTEIKAGVDFHAYSQLNLRPWGKQNGPSPDEAKLQALGKKMTDAIASVHRMQYQNIRSAGLYLASGILCDEFYENHKQMGYTIELRPTQFGGGGFSLPPQFILPTIEENYKAILAIADYVRTGNI